MERYVVGLERRNLHEFEVVERLVMAVGVEAFGIEVRRLAMLHTIDPNAAVQSIERLTYASPIGMSDAPFEVLSRECDRLVVQEPALLERLSYRCRDGQRTALPLPLWLDLVRYAREQFDPAKWDAEFLAARQREGLSSKESFDALIAFKRGES